MLSQHIKRSLLLLLGLALVFSLSPFAFAKTTLTVMGGWPLLRPIYEQAANDYMALHPDVQVNVVLMNIRDFERKLAITIPAGTGPDVFVTSEYIIPQYIAAGYIARPPANVLKFVEERYDPIVKKANMFAGPGVNKPSIWGVPQIGIARVLIWNKDMFAEAGLPMRAPNTWEELIAFARRLTKYDKSGEVTRSGISLRLFGGGSGIAEKFAIKLGQAGTTILGQTPDGKWRAAFDNEAGRDTLKLYIDLLWKYHVDSFNIKHDTEAFIAKKTAMFMRELWPIPEIKDKAPDISFGVSIMPKYRERATVYSTESAFVPKSCKHKDVAWDFILFLNREKYVKRMFLEKGWIPPRVDLDFSDIFEKVPQYKAALEFPAGYKLVLYPPIPPADEIYTKFAEGISKAFRDPSLVDNPEGIAKVMHELAVQTNEILAEWKLLGKGPVTPYWIVAPGTASQK